MCKRFVLFLVICSQLTAVYCQRKCTTVWNTDKVTGKNASGQSCHYGIPELDRAAEQLTLNMIGLSLQDTNYVQTDLRLYGGAFDKYFVLNDGISSDVCTPTTSAEITAVQAKYPILQLDATKEAFPTYCKCRKIGYWMTDPLDIRILKNTSNVVPDTTLRIIRQRSCNGLCNCCMNGTSTVGNATGWPTGYCLAAPPPTTTVAVRAGSSTDCLYAVQGLDDAINLGMNRQPTTATGVCLPKGNIQPTYFLYQGPPDANLVLNGANVNDLCTPADPTSQDARDKLTALSISPDAVMSIITASGETYCTCKKIGYKNLSDTSQVADTTLRIIRSIACAGVCNCCVGGTTTIGGNQGQCIGSNRGTGATESEIAIILTAIASYFIRFYWIQHM